MRSLKTLMLAAVAACALVVLMGAGTASATVLCATNSTPCDSILGSGATITAHLAAGTTARLIMSGGFLNPSIDCSVSQATITTTSAGGSGLALPVQLTALTFDQCTSTNPTGCSTMPTTAGLPASGSLSWISATMNGTLTLATPQVTFTCSGIPCTFGTSPDHLTGTVASGAPAHITFSNQTLHTSGTPGCPTGATWTATYAVTSSLWVADA